MKTVFTIFFMSLLFMAQAQNPGETRLYQIMDEAVILMEKGDYQAADTQFQYVLKNMESLPSDLAYYFGKNSFYLSKYKQSINWLNKYLQLKGTQGRFYKDAAAILVRSESAYLEQRQESKLDMENDLLSGDYDCGGLTKMLCPVCKGQGVVIKPGPFDNIYQTCPYSQGEAYLTCEEYNLFMRGELSPKQ